MDVTQVTIRTIDNEEYVNIYELKSIQKINFNEKTTELYPELPPSNKEKITLDFGSKPEARIYYPEGESSFFLNYRLNYQKLPSSDNTNLSTEVGVNFNKYLFITETNYLKNDVESKFVRLQSALIKETRAEKRRIVLGDFFSFNDPLLGSINMGGMSISKNYKLDPYYTFRPTFNVEGSLTNSSRLEVYLDGVLIRTEELPPGQYEIKDLYYYQGQKNIELVIKDPYGNVERRIYPYYFAENVLRKGEHDYSYNIGFIREYYGIKSNFYDDAVVTFFHKHGYSDTINIGFSAELTNEFKTLSPELSYFKAGLGLLSLKAYLNDNSANPGINYSFLLNYNYQLKNVNYSLSLKNMTEKFRTVNFDNRERGISYEVAGGASYFNPILGSVGGNLIHRSLYREQAEMELYLNYSKTVSRNLSLSVNLRKLFSGNSLFESFIYLSYYLDKEKSVFVRHQELDNVRTEAIQLSKNTPVGEGYGYRVSVENRKLANQPAVQSISPFFEYKTRYNVFTANLNIEDKNNTVDLSGAGALVYIAKKFGFTRPVSDSFALVKFGNISGIPVKINGDDVGTTDGEGKLIVPNLNSYITNRVTVPLENLSLNYNIPVNSISLSPPLRYGVCISFPVKRVYRYEGVLKVKDKTKIIPVVFREIRFRHSDTEKPEDNAQEICKSPVRDSKNLKEGTFFTMNNGEFYLENIVPGKYEIEFNYEGKKLSGFIEFPDTEEVILNLNEIIVDAE